MIRGVSINIRLGRRPTSAVCSPRIIPPQELIDLALCVAVDDGVERAGQIGERIDRIELAGLEERRDGYPVLFSRIVSGKESILTIEGDRPDSSLDRVVVDLDATVGEENKRPIPAFGDIAQSYAEKPCRSAT